MNERDFRLPIVGTLQTAINDISNNAAKLFKVLIIPAGILICLEIAYALIIQQLLVELESSISNDKDMISFYLYTLLRIVGVPLIQGVFAVLFAVTCHRVILLGSNSLPNKVGLYFTTRELKYYGWFFLFGIPFMLGVFVISILMASSEQKESSEFHMWFKLWGYLGIVIAAFITAKFGFILPSTAVEDGLTGKECRQLASGNILPLTIILATPPIAMYLFRYLLVLMGPETGIMVYALITDLVFYVFIVFEVIVLSVSYRIMRSIKKPNKLSKRDAVTGAPS